jgi:hypothetical protein
MIGAGQERQIGTGSMGVAGLMKAAFWLFVLTLLVQDYVGLRRGGTFWWWVRIGWLLVVGASLANPFAEYWSPSRFDTVRWFTVPRT